MKRGNTSLYFQIESQISKKMVYLFLAKKNKKYRIDKFFLDYLDNNQIVFKIN